MDTGVAGKLRDQAVRAATPRESVPGCPQVSRVEIEEQSSEQTLARVSSCIISAELFPGIPTSDVQNDLSTFSLQRGTATEQELWDPRALLLLLPLLHRRIARLASRLS